jgi:hypothetical protein
LKDRSTASSAFVSDSPLKIGMTFCPKCSAFFESSQPSSVSRLKCAQDILLVS